MTKYAPRFLIPLCILAALAFPGCKSLNLSPPTSQQAIDIGRPLTSATLGLVLRNNPGYIPVAQKVGADLATAKFVDLSLAGINASVTAIVLKEGGDAAGAAIITSALDAGLGGYLETVSESTLSNDPNAVLVLQAFGQAVTDGASIAAANPK